MLIVLLRVLGSRLGESTVVTEAAQTGTQRYAEHAGGHKETRQVA